MKAVKDISREHTLWKKRAWEAINERQGIIQVSLKLGSFDTELRKVNASIARKSSKEEYHDDHLKTSRLHHLVDVLFEGIEYADLSVALIYVAAVLKNDRLQLVQSLVLGLKGHPQAVPLPEKGRHGCVVAFVDDGIFQPRNLVALRLKLALQLGDGVVGGEAVCVNGIDVVVSLIHGDFASQLVDLAPECFDVGLTVDQRLLTGRESVGGTRILLKCQHLSFQGRYRRVPREESKLTKQRGESAKRGRDGAAGGR